MLENKRDISNISVQVGIILQKLALIGDDISNSTAHETVSSQQPDQNPILPTST